MIREFLAGDEEGVNAVAYAPDGRVLASAANDGTVRLWELVTGLEVRRFTVGNEEIEHVSFTPDGRNLAAARPHSPIYLWDVTSGAKLRKLGHLGKIDWFALCPDGKCFAVTSECKTMRRSEIWAVTVELSSQTAPISALARASSVSQPAEQTGRLPPTALKELWSDLASADAARAYRAMWALVQSPQQAVAFLNQYLRPIPRPAPQQVEQLIVDLDSSIFSVRESATDNLKRLGELVEPSLRQTLTERPSAEVRCRARQLLEELQNWSPQQLQMLRAIEALEFIGTIDACHTLESLAKGAPEARLTKEARASVERLTRRRRIARRKSQDF
jgi:hypothetical protein